MTVSREQLKRNKYLWGWEESTQAGARTVHPLLHRLGGRMSRLRRDRQNRLLSLSSEMKSCHTAMHFAPVTPQTSPPFLQSAQQQAQSPFPCLSPTVCVKTFMEELENVDLISTYLCLICFLSRRCWYCQHDFFLHVLPKINK